MGQQQLILLALAVVIVGGAIVVGIRAFNENAIKTNADLMIQDAVRIANDMQAWKQKPAPFGGQAAALDLPTQQSILDDPQDYTGVNFAVLGYRPEDPGTPLVYLNLNGRYTITPGVDPVIEGENTQHDTIIQVELCGTRDDTMDGVIVRLGTADTGLATDCTPVGGGGGAP